MLNYIKNSLNRKRAKRITRDYPTRLDTFEIKELGNVNFANWENPLVTKKILTEDTIGFFRKFLSEGDMSIDIGANVGHMTVQMSIASGKSGTTIAFDPNPYVFRILEENTRLNPELTAITAYNVAITEKEDEFYYNSSEASFNNGGISSEKKSRHGKFALESKVKGIHLETFLKDNYPDFKSKLKLIKIDTEGYDKEIIKSISDLLRMVKPVVITECFGKNSNEEKFEQYKLLEDLGYSIFYFSDFTAKAEIIPLKTKEDMLKWKHFDLYAIAN